jgi:hypothetical protein
LGCHFERARGWTHYVSVVGRLWADGKTMHFEVVGEITVLEVIAEGRAIRNRARLLKLYGKGRWRKMKGQALIRLRDGRLRLAELHWYEAHGVGKKEMKRKRYLD